MRLAPDRHHLNLPAAAGDRRPGLGGPPWRL